MKYRGKVNNIFLILPFFLKKIAFSLKKTKFASIFALLSQELLDFPLLKNAQHIFAIGRVIDIATAKQVID